MVRLDEVLSSLKGQKVDLSLHHFPPTPPDMSKPGGGSCLWNGFCPCGHQEDPAWLFNLNLKGVLGSADYGIWEVEQERIPFIQYMLGHRGRLVLAAEAGVSSDKNVTELLQEAEGLLGVLEGLRGVIKDE